MSESKHTIYESRASTHADDCWSWGPGHYKCAVREIERLRTENERLRTENERLLAERDELAEQLRLATIAEALAEAEANDDALAKAEGRSGE